MKIYDILMMHNIMSNVFEINQHLSLYKSQRHSICSVPSNLLYFGYALTLSKSASNYYVGFYYSYPHSTAIKLQLLKVVKSRSLLDKAFIIQVLPGSYESFSVLAPYNFSESLLLTDLLHVDIR